MTPAQIRYLAFAVEMAADWRGSYVGNPDPGPLELFDKQIKEMRAALAQLRHERRQALLLLKASRKQMRRALQTVSAS